MKKLLLINPVGQKSGFLLSKYSNHAPLGLAYVAAVTPSHWEVRIADENIRPFQMEEADLVGITAFTSNINRAYELAAFYRKKKIKVVLGGIHASMLPEEALQFADAVVVGEVEGIWEEVIRDFEHHRLRPIYQGPVLDLNDYSILPRRDLLDTGYVWNSVQTSRGCPFNCTFCSVSRYLGRTYRQRPAEKVLGELESIPGERIAFLDDNLIGYSPESKKRAATLFSGMIERGLKKKWWMQTSMNAAEDDQLLRLASEAGCIFALVGFETTDPRVLQGMKKGVNLKIGAENYKKVVDKFHQHGIAVFGSFIVGNDFESADYYKKLAKDLVRSGVDIVQISILTPLPGTDLMEQLKKEERLLYQNFPEDWKKYRFSYVVHRPQGMEEETIYRGDNYLKKKIYGFPLYPYRLLRSFWALKNRENFRITLKFNEALKRSWRHAHYYSTYPHDFSS